MAIGLQTHIWNNNLKSGLLLAGYPFLLVLLLWLFGTFMSASEGKAATVAMNEGFGTILRYGHIMVGVAGVWFCIAWFSHQSMINKATGAKPMERAENPRVYNLLENLCISRGMTMPKLFIIEEAALNAYASGINEETYAITVTRGIMDALEDAELEAVLAHELSHIKNRDVRLLIIGVIFVGMIGFFAEMLWRSLRFRSRGKSDGRVMLIAAIVLGIGYAFSVLIRFALSRKREFLADAGAVELTKNPDAMANALRKISGRAEMKDVPAEVQQMFIENKADFFGIFATHPPIEERIRVLEQYMGAVPVQSTALEEKGPRSPWS